ncbi:Oxoglutarate and iron-dependent oxygenase degradation C-term-domain-containing protein [Neohortaea acidophila]|uniref:uS12 prolyl 3,4-dihydroxylase n=1 Tax=Neohortaea acidophila TaxID=245834 RepID=A0A6A6PY41_9PEZI|nr:Oxoglutarate and iron-dependent oxygenase degradation C-term-domain-containing protein [Neohortaea acidophila]KAF2485108.1 Oxoglutarate and iron-dependent oxygenase degradation C-term-domain-containing protein [Neohortaea acidophila]
MKRKADNIEPAAPNGSKKKQATEEAGVASHFSPGLFDSETVKRYTDEYAASEPYRHAVVSRLIDETLLRSVRSEILDNIHFTPKETDIYKIHQSGDLANLDGLPESALGKLPSLLRLRNALYSHDFRTWLSTVTGAGALSGTKTDMAVNVYVPGCHLLCHDDVIGSRRVSYILYLNDPDVPWEAGWGGALRLYPTEQLQDDSGKTVKLPTSDWSRSIPPAWNQLSFFAVQPGESFHDVEEVYKRRDGENGKDGGRVRMAISGWFHIPQEGEEGFEPGLEEKMAERSSLQQLQGKADEFDEPQLQWHQPGKDKVNDEDETPELSEQDLEFLLQYVTANYLTPDTVEELNDLFTEESMAQLSDFLNAKFAERLRKWLTDDEARKLQEAAFTTSRPPHKHRYRFLHSQPWSSTSSENANPFVLLLNDLLPSTAFRKWLSLVTGLTLKQCSVIARRFRRGLDYELAQAYEGEDPQLEYCLSITPTSGWVDGDDPDEEANGQAKSQDPETESDNVGGYELYMASDEPEDDDASDGGVEIPAKLQSQTGAGDRRTASQKKVDPAIYKAAADDEDDGIIISNPASWNTLNLVLRDQGTLRFVKYVSQSAPGDRWDFTGCVQVEPEDDDDD